MQETHGLHQGFPASRSNSRNPGIFRESNPVGGFTILKNMKVNGKDDISYMKWKIKFMFQTTNQ